MNYKNVGVYVYATVHLSMGLESGFNGKKHPRQAHFVRGVWQELNPCCLSENDWTQLSPQPNCASNNKLFQPNKVFKKTGKIDTKNMHFSDF